MASSIESQINFYKGIIKSQTESINNHLDYLNRLYDLKKVLKGPEIEERVLYSQIKSEECEIKRIQQIISYLEKQIQEEVHNL
jgi:hypothetical protein